MTDRESLGLAREAIGREIEQSNAHFIRVLRDEEDILSSEGVDHSTIASGAIYKLFVGELGKRAHIVWEGFIHFFSMGEVGVTGETFSELKDEIVSSFNGVYRELAGEMGCCLSRHGLKPSRCLEEAYNENVSQIALKTEIFLDFLRKALGTTGASPNPLLPHEGGAGVIAEKLLYKNRERLMAALDVIGKFLGERDGVGEFTAEEVLGWIEKCRAEILAPEPNAVRLGTFLSNIKAAVAQTDALSDARGEIERFLK